MMKKLKSYLELVILASLLMLSFTSCETEASHQISLSVTQKTLHYQDEFQIKATPSQNINYIVEDNYHASVSASGLVTAKYVGKTRIFLRHASEEKIFNLTVAPVYYTYPEPEVKFGQTKESIISAFGNDYTELESAIGYSNYSSAAPDLLFLFDGNDKLTSYTVMVKTAYATVLADFLMERYPLASSDYDVFYFLNGLSTATTTMQITLKLYNTSYWMVVYSPYTSSNSLQSAETQTIGRRLYQSNEFDEWIKALNK